MVGINAIADLAAASTTDLDHIRGISSFHTSANHAKPGFYPYRFGVDHRAAENPYESKYKESWMHHIRQNAALKPFCPITDLVDFMMEESKTMVADTVHADGWVFITIRCPY